MSGVPVLTPVRQSELPTGFARSLLLRHSTLNSKSFYLGSKKPAFSCPRGRRVRYSNPTKRPGETSSGEISDGNGISIFKSWDVPWDWKVTASVMMPYLMSIVFSGFVNSAGMDGTRQHYSELSELHNSDEIAIQMFMDQLLKSVAKLSILYMFVSPHQPFPDDIFTLKWGRPFNLRDGWILWACGGLITACLAVFLVKTLMSASGADPTPNQAESLLRLLPLIGSSNISTVCLLGILGILAPVCEETLYRGFLMTSLTKWFSLPVSLVLSSAVFACAHQSPGKCIEIFIFGTLLGLIYAQTRNLLAPIMMHACWNSGVILMLTYLHTQGIEIQKYVSD